METVNEGELFPEPKRGFSEILKSYFYWTYPRGCFHYDVMVTLILLFIFVTPHLWNYGDKPSSSAGLRHPIELIGDGSHGMIVTVQASDINVPAGGSDSAVKKALRQAILPVSGDAVVVERWETITDAQGNTAWKIWAHR
ncbi:MAG: hypothetical protein WA802_10360 [Terracidiphilus sp.]